MYLFFEIYYCRESVDVFVNDLKRTLQKDIKKKMCETFAFYMYDKWWQEQEEKYKARVSLIFDAQSNYKFLNLYK